MSWIAKWGPAVSLCALLVACGEEKGPPAFSSPGGGRTNIGNGSGGGADASTDSGLDGAADAGSDGAADSGTLDAKILTPDAKIRTVDADAAGMDDAGADGDAGATPAPLLRFVDVPAGTDPNTDEAVLASNLEVICEAAAHPEGAAINPLGVNLTAQVLPDGLTVKKALGEVGNDRYSAILDMEEFPSARVRLTCVAADLAAPPVTASTDLDILVDHGPVIEIVDPLPEAFFAATAVHTYQVTISPVKLTDDDSGADIDTVVFLMNSVPITEYVKTDDSYTFEVDFDDPIYFEGYENAALEVQATNSRMPEGATSTASLSVPVDAAGPTITLTSHDDGDLVGGEVTLVFQIVDDISDVDSTRVEITPVGEAAVRMTLAGPGRYSYTFPASTYSDRSAVNFNVVAYDKVGNSSDAEIELSLDSVAPWASLDPPYWGVASPPITPEGFYCSKPFDPVGSTLDGVWAAADDGDHSSGDLMVRAVIYDRTNPTGASSAKWAGVDGGLTALYMQSDTTKPLLVDDGAGGCKINLDDEPARFELEAILPSPLGATAMPYDETYKFDGTPEDAVEPQLPDMTISEVPYGSCLPAGTPSLLSSCYHSPPFVPRHGAVLNDSIVYAYNPGTFAALDDCRGKSLPLTFESGWICLAVHAVDTVGNVSVSPPHRVCIDETGEVGDECDGIPMPTCIGTGPLACDPGHPRLPPPDVDRRPFW